MIGRSRSPGFSVDLGPRADADSLAREIRRRIVANLERGGRLAAFRRMWGTVVIVAVSEEQGGTLTHTTLTLRFDWGRLMIHEGRVGRPDVTLWGSPEAILGLGAWGRLPSWSALESWRERALPRNPSHVFGKLRQRWNGSRGAAEVGDTEAEPSSPAFASEHRPQKTRPGARLRIYGGGRRPRFLWRLARLLA